MADDKDVLGRADALLRRNAPGAPAGGADTGGVPVLTDLVADPPEAAAQLSSDIAREVFARVLAEVEGRLASDLEKRVTEHLVGELRSAVAGAIVEMRQELANAIGDAVCDALNRRNLK
ncbi:MAG TPA: hypothetical protein VLS49_09515 [Usitatibacter sp.]|nr:hypothetical protein [Usitatibacter sp.]